MRSVAGTLGRNPFRRALEDVLDALPETFAVQVVRASDGSLYAVTAGNVRTAHRAAAEQWRAAHPEDETAAPYDLVIAGKKQVARPVPVPVSEPLLTVQEAGKSK